MTPSEAFAKMAKAMDPQPPGGYRHSDYEAPQRANKNPNEPMAVPLP